MNVSNPTAVRRLIALPTRRLTGITSFLKRQKDITGYNIPSLYSFTFIPQFSNPVPSSMSTPSYPAMSTTATPRNVIDLKANGEVSRMRNHKGMSFGTFMHVVPMVLNGAHDKGNMPSLPQTKYCTLCPAKFTRTTHLNRHLRSRK